MMNDKIEVDDMLKSPIKYALDQMITEFDILKGIGIADFEEKSTKLIYESLKRARKMWESININGIQAYGMSFDQFCKQCDDKRNILFLSDEEMKKFQKALQIMDILS